MQVERWTGATMPEPIVFIHGLYNLMFHVGGAGRLARTS